MSATSTSKILAVDPTLMGSKLRAKCSENFREHVSAPTSAFAKQQLEKMGWTEGTGLGKNRDGITSHIRVKKRKEGLGLGKSEKPDIVEANEAAGEWWKDNLGDTLARLSSSKSKKKSSKKDKKKKDKKQKKKVFTDEELFQATGGTRFGMRAGITNNLHKWVRTEGNGEAPTNTTSDEPSSSPIVTEEDSTSTSSSNSQPPNDSKGKKRKLDKDVVEAETTDQATASSKKKSKKEKKKKKDKRKEQKVEVEEEENNNEDDNENRDIAIDTKDTVDSIEEVEVPKKEKKKRKRDNNKDEDSSKDKKSSSSKKKKKDKK